MTGLLLALASAGAFGVSDFFGGLASRRVAAIRVLLVSYPLSAVLMTILAAAVPATAPVTALSLAWGAASGVAMGLAAWTFFRALGTGPISIVSPITALLGALLPMLAGIALGERPESLTLVGIVSALLAVVLVSLTPHESSASTRPFTPAVAALTFTAGTAFAASFVLTAQIETGTGLWPLVAARWTATVLMGLVALGLRQRPAGRGPALRLAVGVGVLDVVANIAMLFALQQGLLSVASVLISLFPAVTVVLAVVVLRERLTGGQIAGLVLGTTAIVLIGLSP